MSGGHGHSHAAGQLGHQRRPALLVLGITLADFLARVIGTLPSGSIALLADAGHMLDAVQHCLADHVPVSIEHSTFQFEPLSHVKHERATHA
jgi:Co/Zn/Cd efflux system component